MAKHLLSDVAPRRAAFFDVDGTLIDGVGVGWILQSLITETRDPALVEGYHSMVERLRKREDPTTLTIDGYRLFAGQSWDHMMRIGEQWFSEYGRQKLVHATIERLTAHRARGDLVVLVSGSWLPSLQPLATFLSVEHILCSQVMINGDRLTGDTELALVGAAKADIVTVFAAKHYIDLADSYAYGDDPSDEWILAAVGHPVIVGTNTNLHDIAVARGWPILPTVQMESAPVRG